MPEVLIQCSNGMFKVFLCDEHFFGGQINTLILILHFQIIPIAFTRLIYWPLTI